MPGQVRFRKHQIGLQGSLATAVAADYVVPYRGPIEIDLNREDPDIDVGTLDPSVQPIDTAREVTTTWEGPLYYNDASYLWALTLKGDVTSPAWTFQASSTTPDPFAYITDEWGDNTADTDSDAIVAFGGVIDQLQLSFDEDLGPWEVNADLIFAGVTVGQTRTASLSVDTAGVPVYGADTQLFINSTAGAIGTTQFTDAFRGMELTVNNNLDQKRYANGSNTRFQLAAYGRGAREIELELTLEKSAAAIAEANTLLTSPVPNRFIEVKTTSPTSGYTHSVRIAGRLQSREDDEIGGNAVIKLTYAAYYDATLGYAIRAAVTNTLSGL